MIKTTEQVLEELLNEVQYADSLPHHTAERDASQGVGDWISMIDLLLWQAKKDVYNLVPDLAMDKLRVIAGLCVTAMKHNDTRMGQRIIHEVCDD
jgi:hypothetical protein